MFTASEMKKLSMQHETHQHPHYVRRTLEEVIKPRIREAASKGYLSQRFYLKSDLGLDKNENELRDALVNAVAALGFNCDLPVDHVCRRDISCANCHIRFVVVSWQHAV